jgi:opacity protein-like surface antigen
MLAGAFARLGVVLLLGFVLGACAYNPQTGEFRPLADRTALRAGETYLGPYALADIFFGYCPECGGDYFGPRYILEAGGAWTQGNMRHPFAPAETDAWGGGVIASIGAESRCYVVPGSDICLRIGGFLNASTLQGKSPPNFGGEVSRFNVPFSAFGRATAYSPPLNMPILNRQFIAFAGFGFGAGYRQGTFGTQHDSGWSGGWQFTGGLEYPTGPGSVIRMAYTYNHFDPLKYNFPVGTVKVDTDVHTFTLGYTWNLGSGTSVVQPPPQRPVTYSTGTGRWVAGLDVGWAGTSVHGPDFTANGNGLSASVLSGYHRALAVDQTNGVVTWGRFELGSTFGDFHVDRPGVFQGNIGPITTVTPGFSWQFLATPTRPDICVFILGGLAVGRVQDHFAGLTETRTKAGWTMGAGLEVALSRDWAVRASYTHADLGSTEIAGVKLDHRVDRFGVGLLYRRVSPGF